MHHELRPVDLAVGLGSHDLGVATHTAELYHRGLFPKIVFTGANAPTTVERFPRGEAVHYREHALSLGVPDDAILVEPRATNTGDNIDFTRDLVREHGIDVTSIVIVSRPYQQRRGYAMSRLRWPGGRHLRVPGTSTRRLRRGYRRPGPGHQHAGRRHPTDLGLRRQGLGHPPDVPTPVKDAYDRLVAAGYTRRVFDEAPTA